MESESIDLIQLPSQFGGGDSMNSGALLAPLAVRSHRTAARGSPRARGGQINCSKVAPLLCLRAQANRAGDATRHMLIMRAPPWRPKRAGASIIVSAPHACMPRARHLAARSLPRRRRSQATQVHLVCNQSVTHPSASGKTNGAASRLPSSGARQDN